MLPEASQISISVYDLAGKRVTSRNLGYIEAGEHTVLLDSSDYEAGVYYIRLNNASTVVSARVVIIR